ncbi:hypothetical protein COT97_04350 [Candidatus Falkowbacteria bacterium CG10_big_fil_rev_8_21_14_0_10_39_11]|uniref:Phage holin family protein n=1 Tax=Candidatus Falkowbacteria bacterium CG10_big_fil_rev_8_21_14_0_10_39_11 TaxID=1974565 RepID=A0A2H0V457_9BACT|nr:MAG: hypothetical protein COT97_04350 [Candidatus Falkowbacteria bacterium CG10_big_fil_rev_8_21_14_0_10_39_11]
MLLIIRWALNAAVIYFLATYYPGIIVESFYTALLIVVIFGLVNAIIGSIIKLLTLPINILTLGIGTFFINGLMFWLTSTIVKGFEVAGFWPAFWAALIYSVFSFFVSWILKKHK